MLAPSVLFTRASASFSKLHAGFQWHTPGLLMTEKLGLHVLELGYHMELLAPTQNNAHTKRWQGLGLGNSKKLAENKRRQEE